MTATETRRALLLAAILLTVPLTGCTTADDPPPDSWRERVHALPLEELPSVDEGRLMTLVQEQMLKSDGETRYRVPGTDDHQDTVPILETLLQEAGFNTTLQTFTVELPRELGHVEAMNVYGVQEGTDPDAGEIWIGAHWDSRAWADRTGSDCEGPPVPGANDGAANPAVAIHAAERLPTMEHTIRVALFDVEDQGCQGDGWALGSEHAANTLEQAGDLEDVVALVLVDMPGDENLVIHREAWGAQNAPRLTDLAFEVANVTGADAFVNEQGSVIHDDHVAFLERGIPAVDLIHNDPHDPTGTFPDTWHTLDDTVENLSLQSMAQVTKVTTGTVLGIEEGLHQEGS